MLPKDSLGIARVTLAGYDDTQLNDDEIQAREALRLVAVKRESDQEGERQRKMRAFTFKGGML